MNYLINLEYKPERRSQPHWAEFEIGFPTCKRHVIVADSFAELLDKVRDAAREHGMVPPAPPTADPPPKPAVAALAPRPAPTTAVAASKA